MYGENFPLMELFSPLLEENIYYLVGLLYDYYYLSESLFSSNAEY